MLPFLAYPPPEYVFPAFEYMKVQFTNEESPIYIKTSEIIKKVNNFNTTGVQ